MRSQHATMLERERSRLAEEFAHEKKRALDDAKAEYKSERDLLTQSHEKAAMTHKNGVQELNSQHAIALESERLRLAEGANQEKKKALDDANARFELERDRMTQSHEAAAAAYKNEMQELQCKHAAELESERLRLTEEAETEKKAALDAAADQFKSEYDRMTQSHKEAAAANENQMRELQSQRDAELGSERL